MNDDPIAPRAERASERERGEGRSPETSSVDQIEERLRGPAESWLNDSQLLDFARLLVLARQGEGVAKTLITTGTQTPVTIRVHDRPTTGMV